MRNVFDWLRPTIKITVVDKHSSTVIEEPEDMDVDDREREERLERFKRKQREFQRLAGRM